MHQCWLLTCHVRACVCVCVCALKTSLTAKQVVLAGFGKFLLQSLLATSPGLPQQSAHIGLLLAFSEGAVFADGCVLELHEHGWRPSFTALLTTQPGDSSVTQTLDVTAILERQKGRHIFLFFSAMRPSALWFCSTSAA